MLCTLAKEDNPNTPEKVDKIIKAELPDETEDPEYHRLVVKYMLHGPCKKNSVCMQKGNKCDKKFPKAFCDTTTVNEDGKYLYRRRNDGRKINVRNFDFDNRWVVPHNPRLLKAFCCHVNVERVADYKAVKYLFKYIFKGYDKAYTEMTATDDNGTKVIKYDEVAHFVEQRYISPVEACWRISGKELQGKSHSVEHLPVHLENEKVVVFDPKEKEAAKEAAEKDDKLDAFFKYCKAHPDVKVKYPDMPKKHTWHEEKKANYWAERKGHFNTLGRMYSISPSQSELFHLRLLLLHVESPAGYKDLRTVNGVMYDTYARACLERGLIRDDQEWVDCMEEASFYKFPRQLRLLFVTILTQCSPAKPEELWDKFKDSLSEDFQRDHTKEEAHRLAYISLNRLLIEQGKSLAAYPSMPTCDDDGSDDIEDILTKEEALKQAEEAEKKMNSKQKKVYRHIKKVLKGECNKRYAYLDGAAGTGKSFVFRAIYHLAVGMTKKVTTMAFMGIAATVLPKGRTAHNVFGLPFKLFHDSQSNIELGTKHAEELKNTDIFLWDEAPSAPRYALEIADRKLREIMQNNKPFGGKCIVLTGDFCQTLPIKEGGTRSEIVDLTICSSPLWRQFDVYRLTKNMRAGPGEEKFAKRLRKIGEGARNDDDDMVKVPSETIRDKPLAKKIFSKRFSEKDWDTVAKRAILAMLNSQVDEINEEVLELLEGDAKEYTSIDTADEGNNELATEVLNTFQTSGLPQHLLKLKANSTIILMRNLNVQRGLCNGTRLRLLEIGNYVLKCAIVTGDKAGEEVYIPRITLKEEEKFPVAFRRHQFPVKLAWAMTVNRSQGQTLDMVGLDLTHQAFAAGQLYVGLSRVRSWDRIKVRLSDEAKETRLTKNVVYKEVLRKAKLNSDKSDASDDGD